MVLAGGGGIGEVQVARGGITHQRRLHPGRQGHGLGRPDRLARLAVRPVVAIGGKGDHDPARIDPRQPFGEQAAQPVRPGDRTGVGRGPALVIGHQHRRIGRAGHRLQGLFRARRHSCPDLDPRAGQGRARGRQQRRIAGLRPRREVLQIEDVAGVSLGPRQRLQLRQESLAGRGGEDHRVGGCLVPDVVMGVRDQRHQPQPRPRPRRDRRGPVVGFEHHLSLGASDGEPTGGEDVQPPKLPRQGRQVALVPGVVKADQWRWSGACCLGLGVRGTERGHGHRCACRHQAAAF